MVLVALAFVREEKENCLNKGWPVWVQGWGQGVICLPVYWRDASTVKGVYWCWLAESP